MVVLFNETHDNSESKIRVELSGGREVELLVIDVRWLVLLINNHVQDAVNAGIPIPVLYELSDIIDLDEIKEDFHAIANREKLELGMSDAWDVYRQFYKVFIQTV